MKKTKIYFYGPESHLYNTSTIDRKELCLTSVPLHLDSFVSHEDPVLHSELEWTKIQVLELTQQELVEQLNQTQSNILCLSIYIWNEQKLLQAVQGIKKLVNCPITIIAGGPSLNIAPDPEFLDANPDIDFVTFSQGERAFYHVLEHLLRGKKLNPLNTKNLVWRDPVDGRFRKSDFEVVKLGSVSPFLASEKLLRLQVNEPDYRGYKFSIPYHSTKGCPYHCTFCAFQFGVESNKVVKRRAVYEEELDLLGSLGLGNLIISDANYGMTKEDVEIAQCMVKLKQEKGHDFRIYNASWSKVKKAQVFDIVNLLIEHGILREFKDTIQDLHQHILDNVERPDIPWEDHLAYIQKIQQRWPNVHCMMEIIQGLPGQTRATWERNLVELTSNRIVPMLFKWQMLPNSPAAKQDYADRMKLDTIPVKQPNGAMVDCVVSTFSFSRRDYAYFSLTARIAERVNRLRNFSTLERFPALLNCIKSYPDLEIALDCLERNVDNDIVTNIISDYVYRQIVTNWIKSMPMDLQKIVFLKRDHTEYALEVKNFKFSDY